MFVSVIIPLYNKERFIARAIRSVCAQTFCDFELLVIDDGSTDRSADLARQYGDNRVRVISQDNAGPGAARNAGICAAKGEVLSFLDADDEWLPDFLKQSIGILDQHPDVASVTSGYIEMPAMVESRSLPAFFGVRPGLSRLSQNVPADEVVSMLAFMSPCSTVMRADVGRRYGGFFDRDRCMYAEDAHLMIKILFNETVFFDKAPLVIFHRDASELTNFSKRLRDIEPFLIFPDEITRCCPKLLLPLLRDVLSLRAMKTACVLGYWGEWKKAFALRQKFLTPRSHQLPYYIPSLVCSTPLGGILGQSFRAGKALLSRLRTKRLFPPSPKKRRKPETRSLRRKSPTPHSSASNSSSDR
jgi:glycosyltransferase involved in cell wall biosynthesis